MVKRNTNLRILVTVDLCLDLLSRYQFDVAAIWAGVCSFKYTAKNSINDLRVIAFVVDFHCVVVHLCSTFRALELLIWRHLNTFALTTAPHSRAHI